VDYYQVGHWAVSPVTTGASTWEFDPSRRLRDHLRRESSEDDVRSLEKLVVARKRIEGGTLRPLLPGQYDLAIDRFPCDGSPIRIAADAAGLGRPRHAYDTWHVVGLRLERLLRRHLQRARAVCLNSGYCWPTGTRARSAASSGSPPATHDARRRDSDPLVEAIRKLATELYENREAASRATACRTAALRPRRDDRGVPPAGGRLMPPSPRIGPMRESLTLQSNASRRRPGPAAGRRGLGDVRHGARGVPRARRRHRAVPAVGRRRRARAALPDSLSHRRAREAPVLWRGQTLQILAPPIPVMKVGNRFLMLQCGLTQ
jgi:hypothetical protein